LKRGKPLFQRGACNFSKRDIQLFEEGHATFSNYTLRYHQKEHLYEKLNTFSIISREPPTSNPQNFIHCVILLVLID
jgi:hypothetical protein